MRVLLAILLFSTASVCQWSGQEFEGPKREMNLMDYKLRVMRATEQQAKGVVYNLELKVGQTDCLQRVWSSTGDRLRTTTFYKVHHDLLQRRYRYECAPKRNGRRFLYYVELWFPAWRGSEMVTIRGNVPSLTESTRVVHRPASHSYRCGWFPVDHIAVVCPSQC
uniref:Cystatin domain-containing protein n=1 Tax=Steinernema glaseri TaxID=37863 RepID=A0A1I8ACL3_9BILA